MGQNKSPTILIREKKYTIYTAKGLMGRNRIICSQASLNSTSSLPSVGASICEKIQKVIHGQTPGAKLSRCHMVDRVSKGHHFYRLYFPMHVRFCNLMQLDHSLHCNFMAVKVAQISTVFIGGFLEAYSNW